MKVKFDEKESFLKEVSLDEVPHHLTIRSKGVEQETLEFRFFTPKSVDGHWEFEKEILPSILHRRDEAKGEERLRHNHSLRMIKFHRFFPPRRSTRQFFIDWRQPQLRKEPTTWYEIISGMAEYAGIKDAGDYIRLVMKKEKILLPSTELLGETIYGEPAPKISRTLESYCRFRDFFMKYWERFDYLATKLLIPKMLRGEKHILLTEMRERDYYGYEKARKSAQASEEFIMRRFLKDELESEGKVAQRYKPVLEKATGLYQRYVDKAKKGKKSLAKSCFSSEFDSLINEHVTQVEEDEERGVTPDIEVALDRTLLMQGYDSQLEVAIIYIEKQVWK